MTAQNPAIFIQSESHPAEDVRRMFSALLGGDDRGGIGRASHLLVSESGTPAMTISVASGSVWLPGSEATYQGMYYCENRGTTSLAIAAADASNPRKDLVVARVEDSAYSGSTNAWALAIVSGTPAGSPAEPTAPANSITLALVDVPASDTAITNSQITDRRIISAKGKASQGIVTTTSASRPSSPDEGDVIYETNTNSLLAYDGAAWEAFADDDTLHFDTANNRVGIANAVPSYPLSVTGTAQANGFSVSSSIASVYHAGSLGYTDANHGMLFRPPRVGGSQAYAFQDYAGTSNLWEVTDAGISNFRGSGTSAAYNDGGTWGTISDARLKTITERITDSNYLAKLNKFDLVKYVLDREFTRVEAIGEELDNQETTWEITDREIPSYEMLGAVAQEVQEFAPGLVDESDVNGQLQIKTSVLTWMLVGAVQELSAKLDEQAAVSASLEARISKLED